MNGHKSLGKVSVKESSLWLPIGLLFYHPARHHALFRPWLKTLLPLLERHEGEGELRGYCRPYESIEGITELPFLDRIVWQYCRSTKLRDDMGRIYSRQGPDGTVTYDVVIDTAAVDKAFGSGLVWHGHDEDREKDEKEG